MSPVKREAFEAPPQEDPVEAAIRKMVAGRSREELLMLAGAHIAKEGLVDVGSGVPETKDALWQYIKDTWNIEISRTAVCEGHNAPFDFIWLGFAELVPNLFCIGPRGGGKSFDTALLMELNSRAKPGCESMVFGAVDEQNKKVYDDMVDFFLNGGLGEGQSEIKGEAKIALTEFANGSRVRSYPGTVAKMNGQHPPKAHAEEVEIFKPLPYKESRNMASDKVLPDGRRIKAQNFGTSTRKYKNGRVDKIYQGFLKAKERAKQLLGLEASEEELREMITMTSPWYVVIYCIFEIAAQVENCRSAPENKGRPDHELCKCHHVINGEWDNKEPRTLASVCRGRLHRSRGHRSYGEVVQLFLQNDRGTWEAQQECSEAESEGLYIKSFSRKKHGLARLPLDPANGPFYTGTDWGTTDAAGVVFVQYNTRPVLATSYEGHPVVIPAKSRIIFSELYVEGKTSGELGQDTIVREHKLANALSVPRLPVRRRWADLQGAGDRKTWRKMGLPTAKYSTRNFDEHVKEFRGLVDAGRVFVVVDYDPFTGMGCPEFCEQLEGWRKDENGKEDRTLPQHLPSAARYVLYGMHDLYNDPGALEIGEALKAAGASTSNAPTGPAGKARASSQSRLQSDSPPPEQWRQTLGAGPMHR